METAYVTEDDVKITCGFRRQYFGPDSGVMPIQYGSDGGTDCQRAMKAKHITSS